MNLQMLHQVVRGRVREAGTQPPELEAAGQQPALHPLSAVEQRAVLAWQRTAGRGDVLRSLVVTGVMEWMAVTLPPPPAPSIP
jgi:hypothetical protein